jgi:hypothetical protein
MKRAIKVHCIEYYRLMTYLRKQLPYELCRYIFDFTHYNTLLYKIYKSPFYEYGNVLYGKIKCNNKDLVDSFKYYYNLSASDKKRYRKCYNVLPKLRFRT